MPNTTAVTVRLGARLNRRLEALARSSGRSKANLAAEAITFYVETNDWQMSEIRRAIKEADTGDFAAESEVDAVFRKWLR
jgi:RHH-type rel operon transcriptional repressor/antitoxin RelB